MITKELVIIGGGPAGMSAAVAAYESGIRDILILESLADDCVANVSESTEMFVGCTRKYTISPCL